MRFVRNGGGSPSIVCLILILLSIGIVHAASIPAPRRDSASIEGKLTRRADLSSDDDRTVTPSPERPPSDTSSYTPEINLPDLVQQGGVLALLMQGSDEHVTAILVDGGKLKRGTQLASPFTDPRAIRANGWKAKVETPALLRDFEGYVPFLPALRSLGLSTEPRPQGKNERIIYTHEFEWMHDGRSMQPVGDKAVYNFVTNPQDGCLIITLAYAPEYIIRKRHLDQLGIVAPPLSRNSDMAFLDWKRACTKYNADPKKLRHIFIAVILTPSTQEVVRQLFEAPGKEWNSWLNVPKWEQRLTFQPGSDEGRALLATVQLKGIFWMLVQHREHLGKKAIKQISVFRDDLTGEDDEHDPEARGPSIHLELEDVQ